MTEIKTGVAWLLAKHNTYAELKRQRQLLSVYERECDFEREEEVRQRIFELKTDLSNLNGHYQLD